MQRIEQMSDADVAEVRESAVLFRNVEETTADLRGVLDFLCGLRWHTAGMKKLDRMSREGLLSENFGRQPEMAFTLLASGPDSIPPDAPIDRDASWSAFNDLWNDTMSVADRERFLHWEAAFPGVWRGWQDYRPEGGFDAVIGNPPWDRIKLQEVEWFATRDPELARAPTAAARRAGIRQLREREAPLAADFDAAKERADKLGQLVRASGHYPLLGGGDINLYSLFVERAMSLIKPDGLVGLLTPSGIYADNTAARFFKSVSTKGRLSGLFDFENKKIFFKDVHASFKFCALIFGGAERRFDQTECAFFLHDTETIDDPDRCFPLAPDDFARVNPNTGTAPIFRTRRDADITRRVYERHPVLVDRSGDEERRAWPVRYVRMFDMTNDSHLFRTAPQLEGEGFYPVQGNRWKRGDELCLPLYEGKMVQAFDHRAASVVVNPENLNRPAQPRQATLKEHTDTNWMPAPQFWVSEDAVEWPDDLGWAVAFKDVTAPTNVRTMIASIIPRSGVGNTLPLLMPNADEIDAYLENAWLWAACLNSFAFDFVARQKVQGQHLNWFVVEQLPRHRARLLRPPFRRGHRPRACPRSRSPPHLHRARHGAVRSRSRLRRPAVRLGRRGAPPPARPARRALLPPLRPGPRRRPLRARHLPHRPPPRRSRLRPLPYPRPDPRLPQRPGRRRHPIRNSPLATPPPPTSAETGRSSQMPSRNLGRRFTDCPSRLSRQSLPAAQFVTFPGPISEGASHRANAS